MALDKVIDSALLDAGMQATADAIREKTGSTDPIVWDSADGFKTAVEGIQVGGGDDGSFKSVIERTATNPTLPSDLTSIGMHAFYSYTDLALTSLPDGITTINNNAFYQCSSLALTSLPAELTDIKYSGFYACTNLAISSIPAKVKTIEGYAFNNCQGLTEITFKGKPDKIENSAFKNCTNIHTINVPWSEGEVRSAPWGATNATINYNYTGG